jgi:acyl-coenzyme A synthetase/AMP-(fatty) acid ligase
MPTFPLLTHASSDSIVAWRDGVAVTVAQFLHDVARLREQLPAGLHMLNACSDRYRFTVGLAAAVTGGKVSLLPPTTTPETIRQLLLFAPDAFCLTDADDCPIALPQVRFVDDAPAPAGPVPPALPVPQIGGDQLIACVFTSGSTGAPIPHRKTWAALVRNVQAEAQLCGLDDGRAHAVIGTVPPQHMYGFESTVLVALQSANAVVSGYSFFPADVCQTITSVPRPRTLVTTPVHLRAIVESGLALPPVDLLISATAPLSPALAEQAESCFKAPLLEIYGSTETGQIALRHPVRTQSWTLFPGVRLSFEDGACRAEGGHVETPTRMQDVIEPLDEQHFLLHGRTADLVNIAGKRNSLMHLNLQLNAIPGVVDGSFFMPDETAEEAARGVTRLTAFVVAPQLSAADVMAALREKIDPVFLPRPLLLVDSLPRNSTGKLPREALKRLLGAGPRSGQALLPIAPDHPAFAGHFPGEPIVPGVVLLDEALHAIGASIKADLSRCRISTVKFLSPLRPGQPASVHYELQDDDAVMKIRFDIMSDARKVASGAIVLEQQPD